MTNTTMPIVLEYGDSDDLELFAWTAWAKNAPEYMNMKLPKRPMPERVAEIIAEHEADN